MNAISPLSLILATLLVVASVRGTPVNPVDLDHFTRNTVGAKATCKKPTNYNRRTVPAVIKVRNKCTSTVLAVCLENNGAFHPMRHIKPNGVFVFPTQVDDCWSFNAVNCKGRQLYVHSLHGSHSFKVGCDISDVEIQKVANTPDFSINCVLTRVPLLDEIHSNLKKSIPADKLASFDQKLLDSHKTGKQVTKMTIGEFVGFVFQLSVWLLRHGVPKRTSMSMLDHARGLILHTRVCQPFLAHGDTIFVPTAYLSLYGLAYATAQAKARKDGMWKPNLPDLTPEQKQQVYDLQQLAAQAPLSGSFPADLIPSDDMLKSKSSRIKSSVKSTSCRSRSSEINGDIWCAKCFGSDYSSYFKLKNGGYDGTGVNCCMSGCTMFKNLRMTGHSAEQEFELSCCRRCNGAGCNYDAVDGLITKTLDSGDISRVQYVDQSDDIGVIVL